MLHLYFSLALVPCHPLRHLLDCSKMEHQFPNLLDINQVIAAAFWLYSRDVPHVSLWPESYRYQYAFLFAWNWLGHMTSRRPHLCLVCLLFQQTWKTHCNTWVCHFHQATCSFPHVSLLKWNVCPDTICSISFSCMNNVWIMAEKDSSSDNSKIKFSWSNICVLVTKMLCYSFV